MSRWKRLGLVPISLCGLGAALVMTSLFALAVVPLFLRGWLPMGSVGLCASVLAGAAVYTSVLTAVRLRGRQALPTACLVAGCYVVLAAFFCAVGGSRCAYGPWLARLTVSVFSGGLLAAILSLRRVKARRKHR